MISWICTHPLSSRQFATTIDTNSRITIYLTKSASDLRAFACNSLHSPPLIASRSSSSHLFLFLIGRIPSLSKPLHHFAYKSTGPVVQRGQHTRQLFTVSSLPVRSAYSEEYWLSATRYKTVTCLFKGSDQEPTITYKILFERHLLSRYPGNAAKHKSIHLALPPQSFAQPVLKHRFFQQKLDSKISL